ncbi:hypothetical protein [Nocardia carnea]|uniref:MmyB family transcriptional regulator n=1 Tax=Nocardia carnea TaxID=37328 RepID=UPI003D77564A
MARPGLLGDGHRRRRALTVPPNPHRHRRALQLLSHSHPFHHPVVGDPTLGYVVLAAEDAPEQSLANYTPEPASPYAEALGLLAGWTSTTTVAPTTERTRNPPS